MISGLQMEGTVVHQLSNLEMVGRISTQYVQETYAELTELVANHYRFSPKQIV